MASPVMVRSASSDKWKRPSQPFFSVVTQRSSPQREERDDIKTAAMETKKSIA